MRALYDAMRRRLDAFSVFDWATGPVSAVFCRELLVALRYRRFALMLMGIALVLLLAIAANFVQVTTGLIRPQLAVTNVVGLQVSAVLLILFFVVPALSAVAISSERHQETEDLLAMALEEPLSLIVGKLLGMLSLFAVFHIALLPLSVFTYFFAGIEIMSFFQITFMLYGTALCHSILGVSFSVMNRHPNRALFATYTTLFFVYTIPIWGTGQLNPARPVSGFLETHWYVNPLALLRDLLQSLAGWTACLQFLAHQALCLLSAIVFWWLVSALWKRVRLPTMGRAYRLAQRGPRTPAGPIPDWSNALYHKDCQTSELTRRSWSVAAFLVGLVGAVLFTFWSARVTALTLHTAHGATTLMALLTPLLVLERCRKEMNPASLLMLRVTRTSSREVLVGKALAVARTLAPLLAGVLLGGLLPLALMEPSALTGGHPATPPRLWLVYQLALLPLKLGVAIIVSFTFVRFRAPSAADMAITLVSGGLAIGGLELLRGGLFDTSDWKALAGIHYLMLLAGQSLIGIAGAFFGFLIALTRFEAVFDEGSDVFAARYVDRRSF